MNNPLMDKTTPDKIKNQQDKKDINDQDTGQRTRKKQNFNSAHNKIMNKTKNIILRMGIGIAIIAVLLIKVDISLLFGSLADIKIAYLIGVIILTLTGIPTAALNIKFLLNCIKRVKLKDLIHYQTYKFIGSIFLPLSASDLSIAYFLKKEHDIPLGQGLSTIFVDKAITFFLTVLITFFGLIYYVNFLYAIEITTALIIAGLSGIYLFFYNKPLRKLMIKYVLRKYSKKLKGITFQFRNIIKNNKKQIVYNALTTILRILIIALISILAFYSIGQQIQFLDVFLITNITQFAVIFPITPGGMGIKQGIGLFLFSIIGINPAITLSMYLILVITKYSTAFILSLFVRLPKNKNNIKRISQ